MEPRPLAEGNWLQRRYFAWAARRYRRMPPEMAAEAERLDRWLYSRAGLRFWAGLAFAIVASIGGLVQDARFPLHLAVLSAIVVWVGVPLAALGAWLQPQKFTTRRLLRNAVVIGGLSYAAAFIGFLVGHVARHGGLAADSLGQALWRASTASLPVLVVTLGAVLLLLWGVAQIRSLQDRRALDRMTLLSERDAAARHAAEARLKLLQAQIQPHFIFNTLAALQHWVDSGDARAGPLLRQLTAFLRSSTELMGQAKTTLGAEGETIRHYLQIMQARLGDRLRFDVDIDADCRQVTLPPGMVLTLVENAVEHGVSPALSGGTVTVTARREAGAVVVRVLDDGAGLPLHWRDGIGLANCRERLRHHGGGGATLDLQPQSPGTRAVLRFPEEAT